MALICKRPRQTVKQAQQETTIGVGEEKAAGQPEIPAKVTKNSPSIRTEPEKNLMTSSFRLIVSIRMPINPDRCLVGNRRHLGNFAIQKMSLPLFPADWIAMVAQPARVVKW